MDITAFLGEIITLFIMAFALGMDAFSVGLGMGLIRLRLKQILTIGITIGLFHMWMPLAGMMIGHFLSDTFGAIATYVGAGLLLFLGLQMVISSFKEDDGDKRMITPVGFGLFIFALSVSLDSFSVGLSLGIYGAKTIMVILMFGVVSMVLSWVGLLLGRKVQHWLGTYSEVLGGCILLVFGVKLLFPL